MASTYSTSLKIQLIGTGEQSGVWGSTTNTNWNLIEQAVAGVQSITMINANYTLTDLNGVSDEARNAVLVVTGTNSAIRQIVAPLVNKMYLVVNNTTGGYAITIGGSSGTLATVPNGTATFVYCDGVNFYAGLTGSAGNFAVAGDETVGGNLTVTGTTTMTGNATAPTQSSSDNSTKVATTAYVTTAVTNATGSLGTMSTQNANAVAITGGTITVTSVADSIGNVRLLPIENKSSTYALAATDSGQVVSITTGGVTLGSGVFSAGQSVSIYNNSGSSQTITISGVTMTQAGTGLTGNRTLNAYGLCTILCIASNTYVITGAGVA
jgi:hypothetical protein